MTLAARDTAELVPTQLEVDRYTERWMRAVRAEPVLDRRAPQRHRIEGPTIAIYTSNPRVIEAWNQANLMTGDPEFDAIIAELPTDDVALSPYGGHDNGNGVFLFALNVHAICNEELLQARLVPTSSRTEDAVQHPRDDGAWTWEGGRSPTGDDDDTAIIDFTFGWGDCFIACDGFHSVQARVPPEGDATVYDLGGDPLPPELQLSPNTLPPR